MKRYVVCALSAVALILNAQAGPKDKDKGKANDNGPALLAVSQLARIIQAEQSPGRRQGGFSDSSLPSAVHESAGWTT